MNTKENLLGMKDDIPCDQCGNCCPSICPSKKGNLCIAHPSYSDGHETRGSTCALTPTELTVYLGVACKPVGDKIKELTGITLQVKEKPLQILEFDSTQLELALSQEI
ncbi:MAG: hypothetical protein UV63_C0002G0042 [Microgenomates group bacterium GW2011_GWC1_43_11]|uniref:Uncharacterized protein n=1 Tax=Candidatus Gottesmanbacteria bacterium GW2011_GWB1_44_11c TaxID=1618447 RepID=A0A0G1GX31_9BACT|nr:MAG: hypothetical protein UV63_C0002G0042 [Microgenomates group bacterium GW2011_GWC1_43_11]KKT38778.1 MAG: hypothetical protein UW22_C0006G0044 [Candidatus Gottesmanbacteria bacterium GW2011_GWB1_44_11c]HCM82909.1 hypothetical protein [Patescibacteria group bacterium]